VALLEMKARQEVDRLKTGLHAGWWKIMVRWPTKTGYDRLGSWSMAVGRYIFFFLFFFVSPDLELDRQWEFPTGDSVAVDHD
jgi:hypothetical protein